MTIDYRLLTIDSAYMLRCLKLARLGAGYTAPNPMVGAILLHDGKIIAEGYHQKYGEAHAERELYPVRPFKRAMRIY